MRTLTISILSVFVAFVVSCSGERQSICVGHSEYARLFDIVQKDTLTGIVTLSESGSHADTLWIDAPQDRLVCMSSSHVAALSAIGAVSAIKGVSGLRYVSDPLIDRSEVVDVGYDASLDYEAILKLEPDLLVTYAVGGAEPVYVTKLRSLGVKTLVLHDHLENHPLARAEYVRLFGALTGRSHLADSVYADVRDRYLSLSRSVEVDERVKVLINIPYGDAWYIPGKDGYMSRLVEDAGGEILGAKPGSSASSVITLEQAYEYSLEADLWLNPGSCRTREELAKAHHMFPHFGPIRHGLPIYNNIRCVNEAGGNDFWERGAVRPDLVLEDLITVMEHAQKGTKKDSHKGNFLFHIAM